MGPGMRNNSRLIDAMPPAPRKCNIQVIGLGHGRTGTKSLKAALDYLGLETYHTSVALQNSQLEYWTEALEQRRKNNGKPYKKEDFQKILYPYQAINDAPAVLFMEEFLDWYPDAKIILTLRDPDSWYESLRDTGIAALNWWSYPWLSYFVRLKTISWYFWASAYLNNASGLGTKDRFPKVAYFTREKMTRSFKDHYDYVREVVPRERLLEFDASKDGWQPLCSFLSKEVPDIAYPHENARGNLKSRLNQQYWTVAREAALFSGIGGVTICVVILLIFGYRLV